MKILRVESWVEGLALSRPYTITSGRTEAVELLFVRIIGQAEIGVGSGAPTKEITGETVASSLAAVTGDSLAFLIGRDTRELGSLLVAVGDNMASTPAARAAVDMALHDLFARELDVPLCRFLGGPLFDSMPTSITIGIQSTEEALAEVDEYLGRGFRVLKVKIGRDLEADLERLRAIRERAGPDTLIRVDANEGYALQDAAQLAACALELQLELVEQPLPAACWKEFDQLPASLRSVMALDESVHSPSDALEHARDAERCSTYVVKLMKCGGIAPARAISQIAEAAKRKLMWGCMDESVVSIAAALHVAFATLSTGYLDLDGHLDLARDLASGGLQLEDGRLSLTSASGLGVRWSND
ncbi:MAG: L-alanine-DL-glutamate epimerase-like enolase superfamily enzyme [Planctomycetota bacterium]|jgi:L-alanine-DL-glutamate epimerase-like enolase superfamily enzyme